MTGFNGYYRLARNALAAATFALGAGCGGERLYPVEGVVRVGDRALDCGTCVLHPDDDRPMPSDQVPSGTIGPGGVFTIATGGRPGAPAGKYRVAVIAQTSTRPANVPENPMRVYPLIDQKFMVARTTPLRIVVGPQSKARNFDLAVTAP